MRKVYFYLFGMIMIISLFAELITNNKPIILINRHGTFFPIYKTYQEHQLGGKSNTPVDFEYSLFGKQILQESFSIYPLLPYNHDTLDLKVFSPSPPSKSHILGTDDHGRDILARLIYGTRISLLFGLLLATLGMVIGIVIGSIQGYFGGFTDLLIGRITETWCSIPSLFLILILASFAEPKFFTLLIIMAFFNWISLTNATRSEFLRARTLDYVQAAQILGVPKFKIILKHILPNTTTAITSYFPFMVSFGLVQLAALDFLGFGLPYGTPSLGDLLYQAKDNLHYPWIGCVAFTSMAIILSLLILMGEELRHKLSHAY